MTVTRATGGPLQSFTVGSVAARTASQRNRADAAATTRTSANTHPSDAAANTRTAASTYITKRTPQQTHMSNPFVQRVANWLAQEVVVKGLAENKAFQRFALRTDHKLKEFTEKVDVSKVTEAANNLAKEASKAAESVSATVQREMQATPKPREIGFKSKQDLLREAREKAAGK